MYGSRSLPFERECHNSYFCHVGVTVHLYVLQDNSNNDDNVSMCTPYAWNIRRPSETLLNYTS